MHINKGTFIYFLHDSNASGFQTETKNRIVHSRLHEFEKAATHSGISLKLVLNGVEKYKLDGRPYHLRKGQFLLVNHGQDIGINVNSTEPTEGFCFYLDPVMVAEVKEGISQEMGAMLDTVEQPKAIPEFLDHSYSTMTDLGKFLNDTAFKLRHRQFEPDREWFYNLAENLVHFQEPIEKGLKGINASKSSTRKELYRRVSNARDMIRQMYDQPLSILDVAREAGLSEFHLLRTFKACFGVSPYSYLLDLRMAEGARRLREGHESVSAIALSLGFSDTPSFSKAFRKHAGMPPSRYRDQFLQEMTRLSKIG